MSAPGWYPDPRQADTVRYWDGTAWTSHTRSTQAPPSPSQPSAQVPGAQHQPPQRNYLPPATPPPGQQPSHQPTVRNRTEGFWHKPAFLAIGATVLVMALVVTLVIIVRGPSTPQVALVRDEVSDETSTKKIGETSASSIQEYWAEIFPELFGIEYTPLPKDRFFAARPGTSLPPCGSPGSLPYDVVEGNAFYCTVSDYIAYDEPGLLTELKERFGWVAVTAVIAHEWGHLVQQRIGLDFQNSVSVFVETQADCYTGAYLATQQLKGAELDGAVYAMLLVADPAGYDPNAPHAHGAAFDRVGAFQNGYRNGAEACTSYIDNPPDITARPEEADDELVEVDDDVLLRQAVIVSNQLYSEMNDEFVELDVEAIGLDVCQPTELGAAAWCADAEKLSTSPDGTAELDANDADWFVAALVAAGDRARALPGGENTPAGACLYGVAAAALYLGVPSEFGELVYAISGVDAALYTALFARRDRPGSVFSTTDEFVAGFRGGWKAC